MDLCVLLGAMHEIYWRHYLVWLNREQLTSMENQVFSRLHSQKEHDI